MTLQEAKGKQPSTDEGGDYDLTASCRSLITTKRVSGAVARARSAAQPASSADVLGG